MLLAFRLAGGSTIFLVFLVVMVFVVAYSYYSKTGSGINQRPSDGRGQAPGADGDSHISTADDDVERTVGTRGTK